MGRTIVTVTPNPMPTDDAAYARLCVLMRCNDFQLGDAQNGPSTDMQTRALNFYKEAGYVPMYELSQYGFASVLVEFDYQPETK